MFSSLFSSSAQQNTAASQPPSFGALPAATQPTGPDMQAVCTGVQQRMQAIQSMYSASFLAFSYVLADSPSQIQQVYNAAFQQNVHHDSGKWHEAKVKNPDSEYAYPSPVYGFSALSERSKQQKAHLNNLVAAADNAKTQISNLQSHTERIILTELTNCERRNQQLSTQLAKLMLSIELFGLQNCKASVDFARHRSLLEKVEKISAAISLLQQKLRSLRSAQKQIESSSGPSQPNVATATGFQTLSESVTKRTEAVFNAVLDRCRAASAQAMHERLNARSKDFLAELKREYIAGGAAKLVKLRTMQSSELSVNRLLSAVVAEDPFAAVQQVMKLTSTPAGLEDLWSVVAHVASAPSRTIESYLRACIEFLELKFAEEVAGTTVAKISKQQDKKSALYSYCRQRATVRSGDASWLWFAVFCAFRAGWSSVLSEIALEKGSAVPGLELVCSILVRVIEGESTQVDPTQLNALADASEGFSEYRHLLLAVCKGEYESVKIAQILPECNAFDWIWFGLRSTVSQPSEVAVRLSALREKIDALPANYFDDSQGAKTYPSLSDKLGFSAATAPVKPVASRSAVQLGLMHSLTLEFAKGIRTALKSPKDEFSIANDAHRAALGLSMCLDKFGILQALESQHVAGHLDASEIVLEAALTVAVVNERNTYASAVSAATGKKIIDQLSKLDARRDTATPSATPALYPSLKGQ